MAVSIRSLLKESKINSLFASSRSAVVTLITATGNLRKATMRGATLLVASSASGFQGAKQSLEKWAKFAKMALYIHPCGLVTEKAGLEGQIQ
jgi:hypothetical protein